MHTNADAAEQFAAAMISKGHSVMLWAAGRKLHGVIPQRSDLDKIETGNRAGCWDDWDEFGWKYA